MFFTKKSQNEIYSPHSSIGGYTTLTSPVKRLVMHDASVFTRTSLRMDAPSLIKDGPQLTTYIVTYMEPPCFIMSLL